MPRFASGTCRMTALPALSWPLTYRLRGHMRQGQVSIICPPSKCRSIDWRCDWLCAQNCSQRPTARRTTARRQIAISATIRPITARTLTAAGLQSCSASPSIRCLANWWGRASLRWAIAPARLAPISSLRCRVIQYTDSRRHNRLAQRVIRCRWN